MDKTCVRCRHWQAGLVEDPLSRTSPAPVLGVCRRYSDSECTVASTNSCDGFEWPPFAPGLSWEELRDRVPEELKPLLQHGMSYRTAWMRLVEVLERNLPLHQEEDSPDAPPA